jgi:hypothetical protein
MKIQEKYCTGVHFGIRLVLMVILLDFIPWKMLAGQIFMADTAKGSLKIFGAPVTNPGIGGPAIKFTYFNDQFAVMTGGRGACTINNHLTLGGGGYGIFNSIDLPGTNVDTIRHFKMGYGGLELGYIFLAGQKMNFGASLLIAAGASFWQNKPKSEGEKLMDDDFSIFPVLEPTIYGEFKLNRFAWLYIGASYRYVNNTALDYINDQQMRGFSCFIGVEFGKAR